MIVLLLIVVGIIIFSITKLSINSNESSEEQDSKTVQTQKYVEDYVSKYTKDFTFINCESYSPAINGQKESDDTDWYFHDNELDFDFHVKTLKSSYPPQRTHIACNYYTDYMKKFLDENKSSLEKITKDSFKEIYEINTVKIEFYDETGQIRVSFEGKKN